MADTFNQPTHEKKILEEPQQLFSFYEKFANVEDKRNTLSHNHFPTNNHIVGDIN
jgi:hypothetical protein